MKRRGLLTDPPLLDRLTWREGIRPRTLISEDRGLMARVFGTLAVFSGLLAGAILIAAEHSVTQQRMLFVMTMLSTTAGAAFFVLYRRLPIWVFQVSLPVYSVVAAVGVGRASPGAEGVYALCYVWVVVIAFLFFSTKIAVVQSTIGILAYAVALISKDADFTIQYLLVMTAVLGTSGAVIGLLRSGLEEVAETLATEANTDSLTGIANRRGFEERFKMEMGRVRLTRRPLSLVICDLDDFKAVNDALGHEAGDRALYRAAQACSATVRSIDAVARLGGEEFAVLLPDAAADEAYEVAERIRIRVVDEFAHHDVPLTTSCGIATLNGRGHQDRADLFRAADAALYEAKKAGRNCTRVAGASTDVTGAAAPQIPVESSTK